MLGKKNAYKTCLAWLLHLTLYFLLTGGGVWAAINRGTIRGTVTDPNGAVVPHVRVTITNLDTGVEQTTETNDAGFYLVPELAPGNYKVSLKVPGFVPMEFTNLVVKANAVATLDVPLDLGKQEQSIEVTATNPLVETAASNFGTSVEQRYVQDLPLLGRDIQSLVQLIPGVTQSSGPPGTLVGFNGGQFGGFPDPTHILGSQLAVNGSQASANVWYLDGSLNSAEGVDNVVVSPQPDAIGEFQVVTNAYAAEHGRTAGGVFSVILKSGTNNLHGTLYEYNRNSYFGARNPFAGNDPLGNPLPANFVNWNQFGGTVGGPVVIPKLYNGKNRTFFFGAWDISLLHEKSSGGLFTVPTDRMRQGDFSEVPTVVQYGIYDPMTTVYSPSLGTFTRTPFRNADGSLATKIPADRIDPVTGWLINQYPAPNFLDPRQQNAATGGCLSLCNNYQSSYASGQSTHSVVIKVDHQISEKHKLFGEWLFNPSYYSFLKLPWTGATAPLAGFNGSYPWDVKNHIATLGDTYTFSPTLINEFRFSYTRQYALPRPIPDAIQDRGAFLERISGLNIPLDPPLQPVPQFSVSGYSGFGSPSNPLQQVTNAATVADNITKVVAKHTIKTGLMFRTDITGTQFPDQPSLYFGGGLTSNAVTGNGGGALPQFLLGAVDQGSFVRKVAATIGSNHTWSFYVQDDFRITPKFTLNVGLRYDIYGWFDDRHDNGGTFDPDRPNPQVPSRLGRVVFFGTPEHPDRRVWPANYTDFAPRLNFSYAPFSDRKTVIRGGIDLVYTNGQTMLNGQGAGASEAPGFDQYISWTTDATGQGLNGTHATPAFILSQGAPTLPPFRDPKTTGYQAVGLSGGFGFEPKLRRDPNVLFWNLQVQRELPWNMALSAGYVGSKGTHLIGGNSNYNYVPTKTRLQLRSQLNELVPMPADLVPLFGQQYYASQLYLPYPQYPWIAGYAGSGQGATSHYHAFQLKVEKRFSHGLNFLVAYTNQKTIVSPGNLGGFFSNTWTGGSNWSTGRGRTFQLGALSGIGSTQDLDNARGDRSLAADDVPQILNTAWTYELPFGPGKPFAGRSTGLRHLVGGWKISGNFNSQIGVPLSISGSCNNLTCRPNLIGDPSARRNGKNRYQQQQQWFDPNAFESVFGSDPAIINLATNGTPQQKDLHDEFWRFGTAGYRLPSARSPGFWNMDASVSKDFKLTESKYLQLRMEVYNALNHQNLGLPNTGWCLPPNPDGSTDAVHQFGCQFGRINAVQTDPRALQFAAKFVF